MPAFSNTYLEQDYQEEQVEIVPLLAHTPRSKTQNIDLDLSHLVHSMDEKLPAIIITPCVPSSPLDYQVAFLASRKDEYKIDEEDNWKILRYPANSLFRITRNSSRRARAAFCVALPTVVIGVHFLMNRFMTIRESEAWPAPFQG